MMKRFPVLAMLLALQAGASADADPRSTVMGFYAWRLTDRSTGAPTVRELAVIRQFVTPELACLLTLSKRYQQAFWNRYRAAGPPYEKPPYLEGDFYSSSFEVPWRGLIEDVTVTGRTTSVRLRFSHEPDAGGTDWRDQVELRLEGQEWLISDFRRTAGFEFGNAGSLLKGFYAVMGEDVSVVGWRGRWARACRPSS